jgi:hypothetical protein
MAVAVLIAGMHRSGTSAAAGALNISGVPLGENLLPATPENAKGYWENVEVLSIHDTLLGGLGLAWDDVRPLPNGWQRSTEAVVAREALRDWIVREFGQTTIWGVKDPRLCRLIPLWLPVLRELAIEPVALIVVRNPREVAASIKARDGWLDGVSELLWLRHLAEAEAASRHIRRCAITYEQLLASPVETLTRVAARLNLELPRPAVSMARELEAFVDAEERHQQAAEILKPDDPLGVAGLNQELYQAMEHVAETDNGWDQVRRLAITAIKAVARHEYYVLALANGVASYRREWERVRRELAAADDERKALAAMVDRLNSEVRAGIALAGGLRKELEHAHTKLEVSQSRLRGILQSRSWRMTAPLRRANRLIGDLMRRETALRAVLSPPTHGTEDHES